METQKKLSKQRAYQKRMLEQGRCPQCGKPLAKKPDGTLAALCPEDLKKRREYAKRRYVQQRDGC